MIHCRPLCLLGGLFYCGDQGAPGTSRRVLGGLQVGLGSRTCAVDGGLGGSGFLGPTWTRTKAWLSRTAPPPPPTESEAGKRGGFWNGPPPRHHAWVGPKPRSALLLQLFPKAKPDSQLVEFETRELRYRLRSERSRLLPLGAARRGNGGHALHSSWMKHRPYRGKQGQVAPATPSLTAGSFKIHSEPFCLTSPVIIWPTGRLTVGHITIYWQMPRVPSSSHTVPFSSGRKKLWSGTRRAQLHAGCALAKSPEQGAPL